MSKRANQSESTPAGRAAHQRPDRGSAAMTEIHDVIIVGAGVSGLMLATLLDGSAASRVGSDLRGEEKS